MQLAARLGTGHGAIQWHVATKGEILRAATAVALSPVLHPAGEADSPRASIRATALGVFDAITAHPWVGAQLTRPPWQATMLDVFELLGREVAALGVPVGMQFTATSTLLLQVIGAGIDLIPDGLTPARRA